MKKISLILICFVIAVATKAQLAPISQQTIDKLSKTTTYIVLQDELFSEFNGTIKQLAPTFWTISPYKIITSGEFEQLKKSPNNAFLLVVDGEYNLGDKFLDVALLTLVWGDKSGNIDKMPEILSLPLAVLDTDGESEEYGYKLGAILLAMQYLIEQAPREKTNITALEDFLCKYQGEVKNFQLLLTEQDIKPTLKTVEKIKTIYTHPFLLSNQNEISEKIKQRADNQAIVHIVGKPNNYCFKLIIACQDGTILYGGYHNTSSKSGVGLLESDFQKLN